MPFALALRDGSPGHAHAQVAASLRKDGADRRDRGRPRDRPRRAGRRRRRRCARPRALRAVGPPTPARRARRDARRPAHADRRRRAAAATRASSRPSDFLPELLLARSPHLAAMLEESVYGPLESASERRGADLISTLEVFHDTALDRRAAAEPLHVHPNTLDYRLRRIEELTALQFTDPGDLMRMALAVRRRRLKRPGPMCDRTPTGARRVRDGSQLTDGRTGKVLHGGQSGVQRVRRHVLLGRGVGDGAARRACDCGGRLIERGSQDAEYVSRRGCSPGPNGDGHAPMPSPRDAGSRVDQRLRRELDGDHVTVAHLVVAALEPQLPLVARARVAAVLDQRAPAARPPRARNPSGCRCGSCRRRPRRSCRAWIAWARASLPSPAVKNEIRSSSSNAARITRVEAGLAGAEVLAHRGGLLVVELGQLRLEAGATRRPRRRRGPPAWSSTAGGGTSSSPSPTLAT